MFPWLQEQSQEGYDIFLRKEIQVTQEGITHIDTFLH